ncbi:MAG: hypothetical protein J5929_09085 [Eubacterium sp.]|nr:hypothetical protein [Eubacterium sp.]
MRKMMLTVATVIMTGMLSAGAIHAGSTKQNKVDQPAAIETTEQATEETKVSKAVDEARVIDSTSTEAKTAKETKKDLEKETKKTEEKTEKKAEKKTTTGFEKYFAVNGVSTPEEIQAMGPDAFKVSDEEWAEAKARWMEANPEYSEEVAETARGEYETDIWLQIIDYYGLNPASTCPEDDAVETVDETAKYEEYFKLNGVSTPEELVAMGPDAFRVSDEEWAEAKARWMEANPEYSEDVAETARGEYETDIWLMITHYYGYEI